MSGPGSEPTTSAMSGCGSSPCVTRDARQLPADSLDNPTLYLVSLCFCLIPSSYYLLVTFGLFTDYPSACSLPSISATGPSGIAKVTADAMVTLTILDAGVLGH